MLSNSPKCVEIMLQLQSYFMNIKTIILIVVMILTVYLVNLIASYDFKKAETQIDMTNKIVILETNLGNITIELLPDEAPKTVENFIKLAEAGFYDNTKFHRVIKDFMIQGGDPLSKDDSKRNIWGTGGPGYKFDDEINNVELVQGVIAMANSGPNTNGSQFFIITAPETPWLQGKHTGFGRVIEGLDVVMKIQGTETQVSDRPVQDVILQTVVVK